MRAIALCPWIAACGTAAQTPPSCDAAEVLDQVRLSAAASQAVDAIQRGDTDVPDDLAGAASATVTRDLGVFQPRADGTALFGRVSRHPHSQVRSCLGQVSYRGGPTRPMLWSILTFATSPQRPWHAPAVDHPLAVTCDANGSQVAEMCPRMFFPEEAWTAAWPGVPRPAEPTGLR